MIQLLTIQQNARGDTASPGCVVAYGRGYKGTALACESGTNRHTEFCLLDNISYPGRPPFAISTTTISAAVIRPDLPSYGHPDEKDDLYGSAETFAPRSGFNRLKITAAKPVTDAVSPNSSNRELRHFKSASVISSPVTCTAADLGGSELQQGMIGVAAVCAGDFYNKGAASVGEMYKARRSTGIYHPDAVAAPYFSTSSTNQNRPAWDVEYASGNTRTDDVFSRLSRFCDDSPHRPVLVFSNGKLEFKKKRAIQRYSVAIIVNPDAFEYQCVQNSPNGTPGVYSEDLFASRSSFRFILGVSHPQGVCFASVLPRGWAFCRVR